MQRPPTGQKQCFYACGPTAVMWRRNKHMYWSEYNGISLHKHLHKHSFLFLPLLDSFISVSLRRCLPFCLHLFFLLLFSASPPHSFFFPSEIPLFCIPSPSPLFLSPFFSPLQLSTSPCPPSLPSVMVMQCSLFSSSAPARAAPSLALAPSFLECLIALA